MTVPRNWSIGTIRKILQMHDRGCRLVEICARFRVPHSKIQQLLRVNYRTAHPRSILRGDRLNEVIRMYADGTSARKIAAQTCVSDSMVRVALVKAGAVLRTREKLTESNRKRVCALYRSGISSSTVAQEFRCSLDLVRKTLLKGGVKSRPKSKLNGQMRKRILTTYNFGTCPARIAIDYGVHENTIKRAIRISGGQLRGHRDDVHRRIPLDAKVFERDCEEAQYWIGFLIADGCVLNNGTLSVALAVVDREHLVRLGRFLKSGALIFEGKGNQSSYKPGRPFVKLSVFSKSLVENLGEFGVVPRKTGREKLLKYEFSRHTWRGVIDGDGSVGFHKRGYFWIKLYGSRELCEQFRQFVLTLLPACSAQVHQYGSIHSFGLCCAPAEAVAIELYRGCTIALSRKSEIVGRVLKDI